MSGIFGLKYSFYRDIFLTVNYHIKQIYFTENEAASAIGNNFIKNDVSFHQQGAHAVTNYVYSSVTTRNSGNTNFVYGDMIGSDKQFPQSCYGFNII